MTRLQPSLIPLREAQQIHAELQHEQRAAVDQLACALAEGFLEQCIADIEHSMTYADVSTMLDVAVTLHVHSGSQVAGIAVRAAREASGLTQDGAATIIGWTRSGWYQCECGARSMSGLMMQVFLHRAGVEQMPFVRRV